MVSDDDETNEYIYDKNQLKVVTFEEHVKCKATLHKNDDIN